LKPAKLTFERNRRIPEINKKHPRNASCLNANTAFGTITSANSNFIFSTRQIQIGLRLKF